MSEKAALSDLVVLLPPLFYNPPLSSNFILPPPISTSWILCPLLFYICASQLD